MRGGPGPGRRSRILNTLNEILVFDLSLATSLYALTIYVGVVMGIPTSWYQPKHFVTPATEWRALDWTVSLRLY